MFLSMDVFLHTRCLHLLVHTLIETVDAHVEMTSRGFYLVNTDCLDVTGLEDVDALGLLVLHFSLCTFFSLYPFLFLPLFPFSV